MDRHFYLIDNGMMVNGNWRDMIDDGRVSVIKQFKDVNSVLSLIRKIHLGRINRIIPLPFKDIWCDSVKKIDWRGGI